MGRYWLVLGSTGQCNLVLFGIKLNWFSTKIVCLYILKKWRLVGCFHSRTDGRTRKDRAIQPMQWTMDGWYEQFRPTPKWKSQLFTCGACQLQSHPSRSSQSNVVLSSSKWRVCCILRLKTQRSSFKVPPNLGGGYMSSSRHALASLTSVMMGELLALLDRSISLHWLSNQYHYIMSLRSTEKHHQRWR